MIHQNVSIEKTYHENINDAAPSISPQEWAFFHLLDGVSDAIAAYMKRIGVNKTELAKRMNAKAPFVSRLLSGDSNPSLKTLSKVFFCLDAKLEFRIVPAESNTIWFAINDTQSTIKYNSNFFIEGVHGNDIEDTCKTAA
jgi:transcriptional regulator with XRE-family HTH domain